LSFSDDNGSPLFAGVHRYFCAVNDTTDGPFDLVELAAELRYGNISSATPVRRQGEEAWCALQDMEEYPKLCEIPIDTIARYVEEKARKDHVPPASVRVEAPLSSYKSIAALLTIAMGFIVLVNILRVFSSTSPNKVSDRNAHAVWTETTGDAFSIECPVPLDRQNPESDIAAETYQAAGSGFRIGVEVDRIPPLITTALNSQLINRLRDRLIGNKGRTIVSQHFISENGYSGLDVFFTDDAGAIKFDGGVRIFAGSGRCAFAVYEAESSQLHPGDISRFLDSFRVY
jgi:hypothetical protein